MTTAEQYDFLNRLSSISSSLSNAFNYDYNPANQRTIRTNNGLVQNFQVNSLNELTANTNGGTLTVMGTTASRATNVTVNSAAASIYGDATFAAPGIASDSLGRSATNTTFQYNGNGNLPTTNYTRGQDLSGSLEGAGGIGGLLARTSHAYGGGPMAGQSYYHCDANGNVTMLINSSNAVVAKYLYDALGNILSKSGLLADANLYRFSSKEAHPNSGLVYYLYRYYDPNLQRWPNRDPIAEPGFENLRSKSAGQLGMAANLYTFILNNAPNAVDPLGLSLFVCTRHVEGFPGFGNHAYFWDDQGNNGKGQSCGSQHSCGKAGNSNTNDSGPKGPDNCYIVWGASPSQIQSAMQCCSNTANKGIWFPVVNDCHNAINRCLNKAGLPATPNPRFGSYDSVQPAKEESQVGAACSSGE